jgi:hypothetical protein
LCDDVALSDQRAVGIEWALPSQMNRDSGLDNGDVAVTLGR